MIAKSTLPGPAFDPNVSNGSFADRVSFEKVFEGLEARDIRFTPEEQEKFKKICLEELRKHDGGKIIGSDFGASGVNLVYLLFAFIQNLWSGRSDFSLDNLGSQFGSTVDHTNEQGKLAMLDRAATGIYVRLNAQGGNLARSAELVTGMKPMHQVRSEGQGPADMEGSIYRQLHAGSNIPWGTSSSLGDIDKPATGAPATPSVPSRSQTPPLTPGR